MSTKSFSLLLCAPGLLAGCLSSAGGDKSTDPETPPPARFGDYVAAIRATPPDAGTNRGTIPRTLTLGAPVAGASAGPYYGMELAVLDETRICFSKMDIGSRSEVPAEDIARELTTTLSGSEIITVRAVASLAAEAERPLWPAPDDAVQIDQVEVVGDTVEDFDNAARGTVERRRVVRMLACGPRPAITEETRFLAASIHYRNEELTEIFLQPLVEPYANYIGTDEEKAAQREEYRASAEAINLGQRLRKDTVILYAISDDGSYDLSR